ncbi:MAG: hypothetical protein ABRQ38_10780 [Candidatus Eremiobacterota bacterium]
MKSAKRDFKDLPVEVKQRVKKIIKRIRNDELNPEKFKRYGEFLESKGR